MTKLYRPIDVWRRVSASELIRYRCFEVLGEHRFCVQSADFVHLPLKEQALVHLERNWLELLAEVAPDERAKTFGTLAEAIDDHDVEFAPER